MERRIEQDVDGWPTRPFDDGYDGLRQLASADFSGVVRAGGAWLFFVNGRIVGVFDGELDDVEGAAGSAHKAPHPSLPLLYAMQATGGDTRAKYYTNDTPISDVDETLAAGSFTGYVELSENVLSGDYYQLYHGGRSMSVAFVGNSGKMVTGEDAFERADDEVGIYEVVDVDVTVTELPEPEGAEAAAGATTAADDPEDGASNDADPAVEADEADGADEAAAPDATEEATAADPDGDDTAGAASERSSADDDSDEASRETVRDEPSRETAHRETAQDETPAAGATEQATHATAGTTAATTAADDATADSASDRERGEPAANDTDDASAAEPDSTPTETASNERTAPRERRSDDPEAAATDRPADRSSRDSAPTTPSATDGAGSAAADPEPTPETGSDPRQTEAAWREATTVPSLDPEDTEDGEAVVQARTQTEPRAGASSQQSRSQSTRQPGSESSRRQSSADKSARRRSDDVDDTLEQEVLEREDRIDRLQQRVENLEEERDDVTEERDRLQERVDSLSEENESLRDEIRGLEQEVEELEAATADAGSPAGDAGAGDDAAGGAMAPRAALEATDLFVRYDSKSASTLTAAHGGGADATTVNENLRLDVHTQFEDDGATVDGQPFEAFLEETMAYRFVEWLVRTLPYEIRETDSAGALRDLYDALPEIDRVEFHGEVARDAADEEEGAPSETFDVVVRDKMGEALLVADMNEARDPATGRMIVDLQEGASKVKEHSAALAGAFFVTRSFFEPAALETASEATSGSLLSRDSRKSYVKLSRKQGYHLCLVEARGDDLHLNVPEL